MSEIGFDRAVEPSSAPISAGSMIMPWHQNQRACFLEMQGAPEMAVLQGSVVIHFGFVGISCSTIDQHSKPSSCPGPPLGTVAANIAAADAERGRSAAY